MSIHDTIRQLRDSQGWSQEVMAEKMEISKNSYSRIERGETKLNWNKLQKIAEIFQIDVIQLVEADKKGLIIQQSITFQEGQNSNHEDNKQITHSNIDMEHIVENLKLQIQNLEKLLIEKDARIQSLNALVEILQTQNQSKN